MKTDQEVLDEYLDLMGIPQPTENFAEILLKIVRRLRESEPNINSGESLVDYLVISDDDDDMDSFWGKQDDRLE